MRAPIGSSLFALAFFLVACGGATTTGDGGIDGGIDGGSATCPTSAPRMGDACSVESAFCPYVDCSGRGVVRAHCVSGAWAVTEEACAPVSCPHASSGTCAAGQICVVNVGGAVIGMCVPNPCGTGAVTCDCVCGGDCVSFPEPTDPPLHFSCNTCHTAGGCP